MGRLGNRARDCRELSYSSAGATRVFRRRSVDKSSSDGPRVPPVSAEEVAHFYQLTLERFI